jgi:hypothetical protein
MKALRHLLVATFAVVVASGCVKLEQTLTIEKDGSGEMEIEYSITDQALTQLTAMFNLEKELALAAGEEPPEVDPNDLTRLMLDPDEDAIRAHFRSYRAKGISFEDLEVDMREGRKHLKMKILFKNLATLAQADFFADHGFSLSRTSEGNYLFERVPPDADGEPPPRITDQETERELTPLLGGFSASYSVKVPGRIIRTNAPRKSLYSAEWAFTFSDDPNAFADFHFKPLGLLFDGENLDLPEVTQKPGT